jgi:hypothetical protein
MIFKTTRINTKIGKCDMYSVYGALGTIRNDIYSGRKPNQSKRQDTTSWYSRDQRKYKSYSLRYLKSI